MSAHSVPILTRLYEIGKRFILRRFPPPLLNRLKKRHYLRKLRHVSVLEEPDLGLLEVFVGPGDCVVDIGANIGVYTLFLSRLVSQSGRVYSFEPVAPTFDFLAYNVRKLDLKNVLAKRVAITDCVCKVSMVVPKGADGVDNFYQAAIVENNQENAAKLSDLIDGIPLDLALAEDIKRIKFIKCDVEGHELHCLHGAPNVILHSRPAWLMEVGGDGEELGSNANNVFAFMRESGYHIWVYDQGRLRPRMPGMKSVNYVFMTDEHIRHLRDKNLLAGQIDF